MHSNDYDSGNKIEPSSTSAVRGAELSIRSGNAPPAADGRPSGTEAQGVGASAFTPNSSPSSSSLELIVAMTAKQEAAREATKDFAPPRCPGRFQRDFKPEHGHGFDKEGRLCNGVTCEMCEPDSSQLHPLERKYASIMVDAINADDPDALLLALVLACREDPSSAATIYAAVAGDEYEIELPPDHLYVLRRMAFRALPRNERKGFVVEWFDPEKESVPELAERLGVNLRSAHRYAAEVVSQHSSRIAKGIAGTEVPR